MSYDPLCTVCHARPKMDRCGICEECWYEPDRYRQARADVLALRAGYFIHARQAVQALSDIDRAEAAGEPCPEMAGRFFESDGLYFALRDDA